MSRRPIQAEWFVVGDNGLSPEDLQAGAELVAAQILKMWEQAGRPEGQFRVLAEFRVHPQEMLDEGTADALPPVSV